MTKDMRIRFSGRDLQMLEDLAAFRGHHPRLMIKLLIEEAYSADEPPLRVKAEEASKHDTRDDNDAELDDELPFQVDDPCHVLRGSDAARKRCYCSGCIKIDQ